MPRTPNFSGAGARVTSQETTAERYRSGFATNSALETIGPPYGHCLRPVTTPRTCGAMKALIHHNPACGTSRKTLEILRESGIELVVNEYLSNPPSRGELKRLYKRAGISAREGLRAKEPLADELGLNAPGVTDDAILDAMIEHPILINRPLVETDKGVRLCRPQEIVREIL
jgi:arsenate reductase